MKRFLSWATCILSALAACSAPPRIAPSPETDEPYDLVIENGRVVDGTGGTR